MDFLRTAQNCYYRLFNQHLFTTLVRGNDRVMRPLIRLYYGRRAWSHCPLLAYPEGELLFVHIPKCAGTSIVNAFGIDRSAHMPARILESCDPDRFARSVKFAVIREPLDRLVSVLCHFGKSRFATIEDQEIAAELGLREETILEPMHRFLTDPAFRKRLFRDSNPGRTGFSVTQTDYVCRHHQVIVDNLFSFDQLSSLADWLSQKSRQTVHLPHANSAGRKGQLTFSEETLALARQVFADDYCLWDWLQANAGVVLEAGGHVL